MVEIPTKIRITVLEEESMAMKNPDSVSFNEAHIRNLKIQIIKLASQRGEDINSVINNLYSENEIHDKFYFRKNDIHEYKANFFESHGTEYHFRNLMTERLKEYSGKHKEAKKNYSDARSRFLDQSKALFRRMEENPWNFDNDDFERTKNDLKDDLSILHWGSLPIYKEKYMEERGALPEKDVVAYYDDIYTFKDLVKWIEEEATWKPSFKGDCNLDQDMNFSVYSRRWGHRDSYRIKRTISGWDIRAIAINGSSAKDGTGMIMENLDHDNIFYPKQSIKDAFTYLWEMADEREMTVEELAAKLQNIADWISAIEKVFGECKPDWL